MANRQDDDFFVGYGKTPQSLGRFLLLITLVLLAGVSLFAFVVAIQQENPGTGIWDLSSVSASEGVLRFDPYPVLYEDLGDGTQKPILLVSSGKIGTTERLAAVEGHRIRAKGAVIARAGTNMLELVDGATAIEDLGAAQDLLRSEDATNTATSLKGEIIDSKCMLGVMKPGVGKVHKACATLCIYGGIPPMFMVRDGNDGIFALYLLTDAQGNQIKDDILEFVADPVSVAGELVEGQGITQFRIDPSTIRRL